VRRVLVLVLPFAVAMLVAPAARAWTGPPTPVRDVGTSHPCGVATTHNVSRPGKLGVYYTALRSWTPFTKTPESASVTAAEVRRFARPWQAPLVSYDGVLHTNPAITTELALGDYTRYCSTKDRRFLRFFLCAADWLTAGQQPDGSWRYDFAFADLAPGWSSGMAQGLALSVLCRAYAETGTITYLRAARRAYAFMRRPVSEGGTLDTMVNGVPVFEEYPGSATLSHVLNGSIFALWGVRDLYFTTADPCALADWRLQSAGIARIVKLYDTGTWTRYTPTAAWVLSTGYHRVHVAQMFAMQAITGDGRFGRYAAVWLGYLAATPAGPAVAKTPGAVPSPVLPGLDQPPPNAP
jgi:hypothetical protein